MAAQTTTLARYLARRGQLPLPMALDVTDALAAQLAESPLTTAMLLRLSPAALQLEFGVESRPCVRLAAEGRLDTDRPYLAWPEFGTWWSGLGQYDQSTVAGEPAAVYCCGLLLRHMLTGKTAYANPEPDLLKLAVHALRHEVPPVRDLNLPAAVLDVLRYALARRREQRFQSLFELRQALSEAHGASLIPLEQYVLRSADSGRAYRLNGGRRLNSGLVEFRVGRDDPEARHVVDVDLGAEARGRGVHRRQALLRFDTTHWTLEDWLDHHHPRDGGSTAVNGRLLAPGEQRLIQPGDNLALGPVAMALEIGDQSGPIAFPANAYRPPIESVRVGA